MKYVILCTILIYQLIFYSKKWIFVDISDLTKRNITERLQVQMAYLILNRVGVFRDLIKTWNARPDNQKAYDELKVFIRDEHAALDMVEALTLQDSSLQQTNILQALHAQQKDLVNKFEGNLFVAFESYAQSEQESIPPNSSLLDQQVSENISSMISTMSIKLNSTEKVMLTMLQKAMSKMSDLETKVNNGGRATSKVTSINTSKLNQKTGKAWKQYCWTCGCCDLCEKYCPNPSTGHKNEANFRDRMNESKYYVLGE